MTNRLHHSFILYCILLISILFYSCSNNENDIITAEDIKVLPIINVDSIFINLDDKAIDKKVASIDKIFSNLKKKTGFNGTVLYAEQGLSFTEIGEKLGISKDTVKEHYWSAIKKLQRFF